jgi:O-acetyl-ADP-ribose deacetylase (regulator of RNase III)
MGRPPFHSLRSFHYERPIFPLLLKLLLQKQRYTTGLTGAGRLPFKAIIHVAGISMWWRSSERSIRDSVRNALSLTVEHDLQSIAFPLIGAGTGGGSPKDVLSLTKDELKICIFDGLVRIVRFHR